ncbi:MAG: hypothetical protein DHS20C10_12290 [marine bacterium B5-7]|nr:MAG: hypothetical protein DHS20C10_12290 [marine bacterium B5-7]
MPVGSSKSTESLTSASSADSPSAVRRALEAGVNTSSASSSSDYSSASSSDDETSSSVIAQNIAAIVAATGSDPNVAFCLPSTSAAAPADAAVNTSTSSDTSVDSLGQADEPPRFRSLKYYVSDKGMSRYRRAHETNFRRRFASGLAALAQVDYPTKGQVSARLLAHFVDDVLPNCVDQTKVNDVVWYNLSIMRYALRNPAVLALCRAPELFAHWRTCIAFCREQAGHNSMSACPEGANPFNHLLAYNLYMLGMNCLRGGHAETPKDRETYRENMAAAKPFFLKAAHYGSVEAALRVVNDFRATLRIDGDELPASERTALIDGLKDIASQLPNSLGSVGYYMAAEIWRTLEACVYSREHRQAGASLTMEGLRAFQAIVLAARLRYHPTSVAAIGQYEAYMRDSARTRGFTLDDGALLDNIAYWDRLMARYLPKQAFLSRACANTWHQPQVELLIFDQVGHLKLRGWYANALMHARCINALNLVLQRVKRIEGGEAEQFPASLQVAPLAALIAKVDAARAEAATRRVTVDALVALSSRPEAKSSPVRQVERVLVC